MARFYPSGGAGSRVTSNELTATLSDVVKGKTVVASDTDDEIGVGTLELIGNAAPGDVLLGKEFYNTDPKTKQVGTIPSKSAATYYATTSDQTIPAGKYLEGAQTINKLTQTNLSAGNILDGVTISINNGKSDVWSVTGTLAVQSILSFSAAPYSSTQITFTWKNPAKGPFSGVIIVGKVGSYPTSITDGTRWYKGSGNNTTASGTSSIVVDGFTSGTTYYFRAFSYAIKNEAEWIHGTSYTSIATTTKGIQTFTESGVFTVPENVRSIDIFCVGGGGGGGSYSYPDSEGTAGNGGGGGGGYTSTKLDYTVTPGQTFIVTIGAGGTVSSNGSGGTGGATSFGSILTADGGEGGAQGSSGYGGDGGSGGGGASGTGSYAVYGAGGSDGSDGKGAAAIGSNFYGGAGQGTTTRAFGETSGTLYAGGGGAYNGSSAGGAGAGGDGGGGAGRKAGTTNTGGGGGGNGEYTGNTGSAGEGGSGICIVRWGY